MSEVEAGETLRVKRSIVYGSLAVPIKKPETDHTHRWTVYVRGYNGEDISYYVKRVSFKLHESFAQSVRNIEEAPFEVQETGWGEFQIQIKITFQDPAQRPVTFHHALRLHPSEEEGQVKTSKPVLSEFYDELIFDPPTEMMAALLREGESRSDVGSGPRAQELIDEEAKEIAHVDSVIELVKAQLDEVQTRLNSLGPAVHEPKKQRQR